MSTMETKESTTLEGFSLVLPPHLTANFEKADNQLREFYGKGPGVPALVRFWMACSTASKIRREFELAVLDIRKSNTHSDGDVHFDEDTL